MPWSTWCRSWSSSEDVNRLANSSATRLTVKVAASSGESVPSSSDQVGSSGSGIVRRDGGEEAGAAVMTRPTWGSGYWSGLRMRCTSACAAVFRMVRVPLFTSRSNWSMRAISTELVYCRAS